MKLSDFLLKHSLQKRDIDIAKKMHGDKDLTEEEWTNILSPDFHFQKVKAAPVKIKKAEEVISKENEISDNEDKKSSDDNQGEKSKAKISK